MFQTISRTVATRRFFGCLIVCGPVVAQARADDVIYGYECDTLPYHPGAGWVIANPCVAPQCTESLADGHFILDWPPNMGDIVNYDLTITPAGTPPPPTLWVEWRFRSTLPLPPSSFGCDGRMSLVYDRIGEIVYLHGDAAVSFEGGQFIVGLALNEFHTYRFESLDGLNYRVSVNGRVFITDVGGGPGGTRSRLQIGNLSGCPQAVTLGTHNEWDYVRYGTIGDGEAIVASDPPGGQLDAAKYPNLDRFKVTFDQPNYVYIDDVTVEVMSNDESRMANESGTPVVVATRRLDDGDPETVEIVLDRPLAVDTSTRFTFNTGGTPNTVEYTLVQLDPCCLPSGACAVLTPEDCAAQGGSSVGLSCEGDLDDDGRDGACGDQCPTDPTKISPGQCGCGVPDVDSDSDTIADCLDQCPGEDDLADANTNGIPDCLETTIIPTVSSWGLILLALTLAVLAKLCFRAQMCPHFPTYDSTGLH